MVVFRLLVGHVDILSTRVRLLLAVNTASLIAKALRRATMGVRPFCVSTLDSPTTEYMLCTIYLSLGIAFVGYDHGGLRLIDVVGRHLGLT